MYHDLLIFFCNYLQQKMSIASNIVFDFLKHLLRFIMHILLTNNKFKVTQLKQCFIKNSASWMIETKMISVQLMYLQALWHIYPTFLKAQIDFPKCFFGRKHFLFLMYVLKRGIFSKYLMDRECNCSLPSKVNGNVSTKVNTDQDVLSMK